jgi:undecaprenyl-diphosphatase
MGSPARLSIRHALALGLAHGPTELLPISSSAHTILIPWLAGWPYAELDPELRKSFEVALHAGTAAALLNDLRSVEFHPGLSAVLQRLAPTYFGGAPQRLAAAASGPSSRHSGASTAPHEFGPTTASSGTGPAGGDLLARQALVIALSFIPPAVIGYTFEQFLQRRLSGPSTIAGGLLLGGAAMALADALDPDGTRTLQEAGTTDGLLLGLAQTLALVPGVSRSGAVLTAARARGFSRPDSHTLARRTGLPVILGAGALKTGRLLQRSRQLRRGRLPRRERLLRHGAPGGAPISDRRSAGAVALGGTTAFLSTLAATRLLRRESSARQAAPLLPYALYRALLASLTISRLRGAHNGGV